MDLGCVTWMKEKKNKQGPKQTFVLESGLPDAARKLLLDIVAMVS